MSHHTLNIVGLGVSVPAHITREAADVLSACTQIFTLVQEPPSLWLPPAAQQVPVTNLMDLYVERAIRVENYQRAIERVWIALRDQAAVAYVTYGNPFAFDSVAQGLANNAHSHGVLLRVVPGVSSIDTLLCDLRTDMAPGIQIVEASWLVATRLTPNTSLPVVLLQMGAFGSFRAHYRHSRDAAVLKPLEEHLRATYPASHRVALIHSGGPKHPSRVVWVPLGGLTHIPSDDFMSSTMFIPPLTAAPLDAAIKEQMEQA